MKEAKQEITGNLVFKESEFEEFDEAIIKIKKLFFEICDISNQRFSRVNASIVAKLSQKVWDCCEPVDIVGRIER